MKKIIAYFIILISCCACQKGWLDAKSNDKLSIPASLDDFQALLDNRVVMNLNSPALQEIASDGHYLTPTAFASQINSAKNAYTWSHEWPYEAVADWNNTYRVVFQCNLILDGLSKLDIEQINLAKYNNVKGQALFQRAKAFYEISQLWAPPYKQNSAGVDLGIPLRLTPEINVASSRATVERTYSQIINDLNEASLLLPVKPGFKHRGSKFSVFALLARIYMSMEDYERAKTFSDSCFLIDSSLLNFNSIPINNTNPYPTDYENNPEVIYTNNLAFYSASSTSALIDSNLYNSYSSDDLRKKAYYRLSSNGTISFKRGYVSINFGGLANDEVYLNRAECNARAGNKEAAMQDLNRLMSMRWKSSSWIPFEPENADSALVLILTERKKELILRGLRWSDLRRLNKDSRFEVLQSRTINGKTYTIEPNSYKYTFPIPDDVLVLSGIQQNPNW